MSGRYTKKQIKGYDDIKFPLKIQSIGTKGKFMWFTLAHNDDVYYMLNTFGLTGKWSFDKLNASHVKFVIESPTEKYNLYFSDVRNFGTIEFTKNINNTFDSLPVTENWQVTNAFNIGLQAIIIGEKTPGQIAEEIQNIKMSAAKSGK